MCGALALAAVWPAAAQVTGNADAGRQTSSMCVGCHNIGGYKTAFPAVYSVPKIDRQHASYIASVLRAYKSGARKNAIMAPLAGALTQRDMEDLAAFYAQQQGLVTRQGSYFAR